MDLIIYIVIYPFIWIISRLNFTSIYFVSDLFYYVLYYVFGYRKKVVRNNLKLAFPNKSDKDRILIEKKYFRNLADVFLESFKTMNISEDEMKKRYKSLNPELLDKIYDKNQNVILIAGHYCSWEWVFILDRFTKYKINAIYKKLSNKYFDNWARSNRSKYDGNLISTKETYREILRHSKTDKLNLYGFASDQSPRLSKASHWGIFLGNNVPIHVGAEVIAKKYNMAVVFMDVQKVKRGFYEVNFETITEKPKDYEDYEITDQFIKRLELQIIKKPEFYTLTHKRFKHKKSSS